MDSELKAVVRDFLRILETKEATDDGREFHPNTISSCRVQDYEKLGLLLNIMKELTEDPNQTSGE